MSVGDFINRNLWFLETTRSLAMHLRLYYPWNKYYMYKLRKSSPIPPFMLKARTFFESNESRINEISEYLADEQSRETFHKLIHMRQYYENTDIPQYNYFDQYFPKDIIKFSNKEVFIDGGGFTGDTLLRFRKRCPNYKRIVTFEPDKRNISRMKRKVGGVKHLSIIEAGMSDTCGGGNFKIDKTGLTSKVVEEDTGTTIRLVKLDSVPECQDATFIKMDIEGAELAALQGGRELIQRNKPKLAICIYHSDEDMLSIAEYIHELVPEYRIYMRAHNIGITENVLYAVI